MDGLLVVIDSRQLRVLVRNRVPNQIQGLERVQILELGMKLCDFVVLGVDLPEGLQLLDAAQIGQAVAR